MTNQNDNLKALSDAGVSIWLDDLNRPLITSGRLQELIETRSVVGVTTNPSIFAAALSEGDAYNAQVKDLAQQGKDVNESVFALTTDDVRNACDIFLPLYEATGGQDGRVSIEVDPRLAADTAKTVEEAKSPARERGPAQRAHQDPGHASRACRPSPRCWPRASASTSR